MIGRYFSISRENGPNIRMAVLGEEGCDILVVYERLLDTNADFCHFRKEHGVVVQEVREIADAKDFSGKDYDLIYVLGNSGSAALDALRKMAHECSPFLILTIVPDIRNNPAGHDFAHYHEEGRVLVDPLEFISTTVRIINDFYVGLEGNGLIGIDLSDLVEISTQNDLYPFFADITEIGKPAKETVPAALVSKKGPLEKLEIRGLFASMVFGGGGERYTIDDAGNFMNYFTGNVLDEGRRRYSADICPDSRTPLRVTGILL